MARPKRFELLTPRFVVWCSIQLSYGRFCASRGRLPRTGRSRRERASSYRLRPVLASLPRRSRPCALAAPGVEVDRPIRDGQAEGRPDGAVDQADFAAVGAHQLGHDGEPEPDAAGAGRALEGLEQMRARALG